MATVHKVSILTELEARQAQAAAEKLHKTIKATKDEAGKIIVPGGAAALNAAYKGQAQSQQLTEYGQIRAMRTGGTGASARDFAQEAQGLGGLVRLYATWAANIFAVSAAFNVLKEAAEKSRLAAATDLFSAKIGTNLRGIASEIQKATDHAISFQEAMQFTNIGTSVGMAKTQIVELTTIAKGAANALGRDTTDSVRRIIQGTAKQEQEILDELGIFVKAKDAYEKYAKELDIKGGADALSATQKVQAYSKAVQEAGQKWKEFSTIEDPFSKFTATGKEALQGILEVINKGLEPILKFLAETPGAIQSIALMLAASLTKRALPEMSNAVKDAFQFSKYANMDKLTKQLTGLTAELGLIKKEAQELQKILDAPIPKLEDRRAQLIAKTVTGTDKTGDRATIVAQNAIFGVNSLKDTSGMEKLTDFHHQIERSLANQIARTKDKDALLQKLIQANILDAKATADKVVLGSRQLLIAEEALVINRASTAEQAAHNKMLERTVVLEEQELKLKQQILSTEEARTATGTSKLPAQARQGMTAGAALSEAFTKNMAGQMVGLTGFIRTVGMVPSVISTAVVGLTGFRLALATVQAAASTAAVTIGAALQAFLGPIMIAWTVWELFGEKITDFIGITSDLTRKVDKEIESFKESTKELTLYNAAMSRYSDEKAKLYGEAYLNVAGKELDLITKRRQALEDELKVLLDIQKVKTATGKRPDELSREEQRAYNLAEMRKAAYDTPGASSELRQKMAAELVQLKELWDAEDNLEKLRKSKVIPSAEALREAQDNLLAKQVALKLVSTDLAKAQEKLATEQANAAKKLSMQFKSDDIEKDLKTLEDRLNGFDPQKVFKNTQAATFGNAIQEALDKQSKLLSANKEGINTYLVSVKELQPLFGKLGIDVSGLTNIVQELNTALEKGSSPEVMSGIINRVQEFLKGASSALISSKFNTSFDKKEAKEPAMPNFSKQFRALSRAQALELDILRDNLTDYISEIELATAKGIKTETDALLARRDLNLKYNRDVIQAAQRHFEEDRDLIEKKMTAETNRHAQRIANANGDEEQIHKLRQEFAAKTIELAAEVEASRTKSEDIIRAAKRRTIEEEHRHSLTLAQDLKKLSDQYRDTALAIKEFWQDQAFDRTAKLEELQFQKDQILLQAKEATISEAANESLQVTKKKILDETKKLHKIQLDITELEKTQNKETEEYKKKYAEYSKLAEQQKGFIEEIRDNTEEAAQFAKEYAQAMYDQKAAKELQNSLSDAIITALTKGGKEGAKSLREIIQNALLSPFKLSMSAVLNPIASAVNSGVSSIVGQIAGSVASNVFGFSSGTTLTAGLSSMGQALYEGFAAGAGYTTTSVAAAQAAAAEMGLAGTATTAAAAAAPGTYAAGNMLGSVVANPLTWIALPIISQLMRSTKQVGGGITGELGGSTYDYKLNRKSGWLLGGPDYSTETSSTVSGWDKMIQSSWQVVTKSTLDMAKALNLTTTGLENFKVQLGTDSAHPDTSLKGINLDDLMGKGLTDEQYSAEVRKRISQALAQGSNELAQQILGEWKNVTTKVTENVNTSGWWDDTQDQTTQTREVTTKTYVPSEYARADETAIETLTRLATSLTIVNDIWKDLGYTLVDASLAGGSAASTIADAFGGLEKFSQVTAGYYSVVYSESERYNNALTKVQDKFSELGYKMPSTTAEFRSLVESIGTATPAAQQLTAELMALAPAWDTARNQIKEKTEEIQTLLTDKFLEAVEAGYSPEQTGKYVADQLLYSIQRTMYDSTVGEIMNTFSAGIITPILNAAKSGANASTLIAMLAEGEVQSTLAKVRVMAQNLATVMNSQAWKDLQQTFSGVVQDFVSTVQTQLPTLDLVAPSITDAGSASSSATTEVDKLTESLKELAKSSVTSLFDTLTSTLKKNADTIKSSITKLKDFIKSITEFKTSLLLGDKSTLTSSEKYLKAKTDFETTYAKAQTGDETAIGKLQTVSEGFLEASRDFYASGSQYTSDFNSVMSAIDSSVSQAEQLQQKLETNLRDVYDQLVILDSIDSNITDIKAVLEIGLAKTANQILAFMDKQGDTGYTAQALLSSGLAQTLKQAQQLIAAYDLNKDNIASKDEIRHAGNIGSTTGSVTTAVSNPSSLTVENASKDMLNTYGAYTVGNIGSGYAIADPLGAVATSTDKTNWSIMLRNGVTAQSAELKSALEQEIPKYLQQGRYLELRNALVQFGLSQHQLSAIMGWPHQDILNWVAANNLPAFAQGTNYVPYDMPAMIHEGERIFPKADNEELMKSVKGNNNAELITEIRRLNDKVASLERTVAQGAAVNAQATDRNTEAVVGAVSDSTNRTIQSNNIRERATLR